MLDITKILQMAEDQKTFEINITEENEEDNWILKVKKPSPRKSQKWINFMLSNFMTIKSKQASGDTSNESIGGQFLVENMDTLIDFAGEILDLAESWEGITAENKKQIKEYMLLTPMQAASFAINFISDFNEWQGSLKKSLPPESNGNSV